MSATSGPTSFPRGECRYIEQARVQVTCQNCQGFGYVVASWGEQFHCHVCMCTGKVWVDGDGAIGGQP